MRRRTTNSDSEEPPRKKFSYSGTMEVLDIKPGEIMVDLTGKPWKLGKAVGYGGFGEIFLASDDVNGEVSSDSQYVAKVETHANGPLFVEINCYLRIAKKEMIDMWKEENKISRLGMPYYIASGSHLTRDLKYRFLIIPRFEKDLEQVFESAKRKFNLKTVLTLALQLLDILEYIHSKGYVHSDIKASNMLLLNKNTRELKSKPPVPSTVIRHNGTVPLRSCRLKKLILTRALRPNGNLKYVSTENLDSCIEVNNNVPKEVDQVYLLDFGLASKYLQSNGEHKEFCSDERKAHAGTILFCSLDAHKGAQSRRSDLESLGYNIIYWLTSDLPWIDDIEEPQIVHKKKQKCLANLHEFFSLSFSQYPRFLYDYFKYLVELGFQADPDYDFCRNLFRNALKEYGYKDNSRFDFNNVEGWGNKQKRAKVNSENRRRKQRVSYTLNRVPLTSNLPVKLELRKKRKNKKIGKMNWSKILMDPEIILKQKKVRDRKLTECSDPGSGVSQLDINQLNPTYAMLEVYNKSMERVSSGSSPRYKGDSCQDSIDGYTSAMMAVYNRKKEREEMELEKMVVINSKSNSKSSRQGATTKKGGVKKKKSTPSPKSRHTKSAQDLKKELPTKKAKSIISTRSHRLRG